MTIITLGASGVALVALGSLTIGPMPPWVILFFVVFILTIEVVPVYFAITYWRVRHGKIKQPTVPVPISLPRDHKRSGD